MFGSNLAVPVLAIALLSLAAVPLAIALDGEDGDLVQVDGTVKQFVCCDAAEDGSYDDDLCYDRAGAFILETDDHEEILVEFGPWWYWTTQEVTVKDIVEAGDRVSVNGELDVEDDGTTVVNAWKITDLGTQEEITIKVEGSPPWAGGPNELGIEPWPPSDEEE